MNAHARSDNGVFRISCRPSHHLDDSYNAESGHEKFHILLLGRPKSGKTFLCHQVMGISPISPYTRTIEETYVYPKSTSITLVDIGGKDPVDNLAKDCIRTADSYILVCDPSDLEAKRYCDEVSELLYNKPAAIVLNRLPLDAPGQESVEDLRMVAAGREWGFFDDDAALDKACGELRNRLLYRRARGIDQVDR